MTREQDQFLEVLDRGTAEQRWWDWLRQENLVLGSQFLLDVLLANPRML
jgi:hypothetical protein